MRKFNLILFLALITFQSCKDDCGECFTPPESFLFEIIDKTSGENLFTNGTYKSEDITITDALNNNNPVEFRFISENSINVIEIGSIGWEREIVSLAVDVSGNHIFDFYVDAKRKNGKCCSYTEYDEITISNAEFEMNSEIGGYKILVE